MTAWGEATSSLGPVAQPRGGFGRGLPRFVQAGLVRQRWRRTRHDRAQLARRPGIDLQHRGTYTTAGMAHVSDLYRTRDVFDRPWAFLHVPSTGHGSLVLDCDLGSLDLRDQDTAQQWVAEVGVWLAMLTHEQDVAACAITLDRPPSSLASADTASPKAAEMTGRGQARIQLTYRPLGPHGRHDVHAIGTEVGAQIPQLVRSLRAAGIAEAMTADADTVASMIAQAYNGPAAAADLAPATHEEWGHLRHGLTVGTGQDRWLAASVTWSLSQIASAVVLTQALPQLLASRPTQAGTRVSLVYQRRVADSCPRWPDPDRQTWSGLPERREGTAIPPLDAAHDQVPRFTMLVTATTHPDRLRAAARELTDSLDTSLRPWLRPLYGAQAAGFATSLPLGLLLRRHAGRAHFLHDTVPARTSHGTTLGRPT